MILLYVSCFAITKLMLLRLGWEAAMKLMLPAYEVSAVGEISGPIH